VLHYQPALLGPQRLRRARSARTGIDARGVRGSLKDDGTLWLNLGDCYATGAGKVGNCPGGGKQGESWKGFRGDHAQDAKRNPRAIPVGPHCQPNRMPLRGLKPKDLVGIPWRVAFALQADGWYLRSDIIWHKPNPMPESVTDRPTKAHEYLFLLAKSPRYYYDAEAIAEPCSDSRPKTHLGRGIPWPEKRTRNRRTVWTITPQPFRGAHFATFPPKLIEPCILAGTSERGCCPECGAPWVREVEAQFIPQRDVNRSDGVRGAGDQKPMDASNGWQGFPRGTTQRTTKGWRASCDHQNKKAVPCTVLDPFAGAATTGLVAKQFGRRFIGIELNPEYVAMSYERAAVA
jgi:DNA methylase